MKRRMALSVVSGLLVLALQLGCSSVGRQKKTPGLLDGSQVSSEPKLGAKDTAIACLATAKELEKANSLEPAIEMYEKARQNDPKLGGQVSRRLAVLYDKKGEFTKAMDEYSRALKESPKDADLLNNIGYSFYCRGQYAEAEQRYRKALTINPHNVRVWNNLGLVLGMTGNVDGSLEAFEKAVSKGQARSNIAFILATQGRNEEAKHYYQKALEVDPSLKVARAALAKLSSPAAPTSSGLVGQPASMPSTVSTLPTRASTN